MDIFDKRPFVLYSTDNYFMLKTRKAAFTETSHLKINRLTSKISVLTQVKFEQQLKNIEKKVPDDLWLVMGIMIVNQEPYLCIVKQAETVATLNKGNILCISNVDFIPFKHKFLYYSIDQQENDKILKQLRERIIEGNFYFCYHMDLTLSYQKQLQKRSTESKYFWNQSMLAIFMQNNLPPCWCVPVVQGYIKELSSQNSYFSFYYCTISRRSKFMSGTRFNSRGIDADFNASNFVQTEEIFLCHNYLFSHISIRGSVPIFWSQAQFGATITFEGSDEENMHAIERHYQLLKKEYQANVVTVNLLSQVKSPEKQLKKKMELYLSKTLASEPYAYYDLNQDIKEKEHPTKLIDKFINCLTEKLFPAQSFLCFERDSKKVLRQQHSVPRINCLDCIDRTNVIMSRLSLLYLKQIAQFVSKQDEQTEAKEKQLRFDKEYIDKIVTIWAELGDRISMMYCGTSSVATHLTKQEKNSFLSRLKGGFRSLNRYYNANVNDSFKQTCLDFLLARKQEQSITNYFDDNITRNIIKEAQYCSYNEAVVYVLSWNCNTVDPEELTTKSKLKLFDCQLDKTDIVVVCLQEMVELNSYNVLIKNNDPTVEGWRNILEKHLKDRNKNFVYLASSHMVGVATLVFVNQSLQKRVRHYQWLQVKTGFKNSLGNKGAILLFLQIDSSYLTIINCHLAAGENFSNQRQQDIQYIHNEALNQRQHRRLFDKSQYKFFVGDMNFRLETKNQTVREILYNIEKQDAIKKLTKSEMQVYLQTLLQKDQYHLTNFSGALSMYTEGSIYFLPTYKFVKKEKIYDTKRTPSWCDRILFYSQEPKKIELLKYSDIGCYQSDHKPIFAAFRLQINQEDLQKRAKLFQNYFQQAE